MNKVFLISCVSKKLPLDVAEARDLYCSTWFQKARAYAEKTGDRWFILSARYGLLRPDELIAPYNETMKVEQAAREAWAGRVLAQMRGVTYPLRDELVVLAGWRYREPLVEWLRGQGYRVTVPMQGLGIGQQVKWLGERAR